jgi:hypothetical protein
VASIVAAWVRRNFRHVVSVFRRGAGGIVSALRARRIVQALTREPSLSSSPRILWYPQLRFSVASRWISAVISSLTGGRPCPVRVGPVAGDQAAVPAQDGGGSNQPVQPQPWRQQPDQRGEDRPVCPVEPCRGLVRRSTATSCRSTSSSASFEADDRPSRASQPQTPDEDEIEQAKGHG